MLQAGAFDPKRVRGARHAMALVKYRVQGATDSIFRVFPNRTRELVQQRLYSKYVVLFVFGHVCVVIDGMRDGDVICRE